MPRPLIADSDDESEAPYSPPPQYRQERDASSGIQSHETASTDPLFFQRVFTEHSVAAREQQLHQAATDMVDEETSSVNPKTHRASAQAPQDTTPQKNENGDPWQVPSSPGLEAEGVSDVTEPLRLGDENKSSTVASSRKRRPLSNSLTPRKATPEDDSGAGEGSRNHRARKRRKKDTFNPMIEKPSVDIIDISSSSDSEGTEVYGRQVGHQKQASLMVAPPRLCDSQKKQYEAIGTQSTEVLSSATRRRIREDMHRSSGTATNINTPRSDDPLIEAGVSTQAAAGRSRASRIRRRSSSPDVISADTIDAIEQGEPQATMEDDDPLVDELADLDHVEDPQPKWLDTDDDPDYGSPVKSPPKKRRRGRPKKGETAQQIGTKPTAAGETGDVKDLPAPVRKKRGRPRKSEVKVSPPPEEDQGDGLGSPAAEASVAVDEKEQENAGDIATNEQGSDGETSKEKVTQETGLTTTTAEAVKTPPKTKTAAMAETKVTASKLGGPVYRVGLSKKSRIAPLLKMVKK